jgi:RNA polymerase sigma-70 factor, ECF subfamily
VRAPAWLARPAGQAGAGVSAAEGPGRAEEFESLRPLLFSIAYRLLGSVAEAEDAVQETWVRFQASAARPASARAFLSAVVTRVSIDVLRSARVRREEYTGPWFPEPLLEDPYQDPERAAELADSVSMAALLLLERLSPAERAVFVLREVFGFGFAEISAAVGRSEAACRQLAVRARQHMSAGRARFASGKVEQAELARRFLDALRDGDVGALRELLAADVQLSADSGGKAPKLGERVAGADKVARLLGGIVPEFVSTGGTLEPRLVNGQPGAVIRDRDGRVVAAFAFDIAGGQVQLIRAVLNPDKLRHVGPLGDAWAALHEVTRARRAARPGREPGGGGTEPR